MDARHGHKIAAGQIEMKMIVPVWEVGRTLLYHLYLDLLSLAFDGQAIRSIIYIDMFCQDHLLTRHFGRFPFTESLSLPSSSNEYTTSAKSVMFHAKILCRFTPIKR